jgi:hypothetical protein
MAASLWDSLGVSTVRGKGGQGAEAWPLQCRPPGRWLKAKCRVSRGLLPVAPCIGPGANSSAQSSQSGMWSEAQQLTRLGRPAIRATAEYTLQPRPVPYLEILSYSTPPSVNPSTAMDSLDCSIGSVSSVLLGSLFELPRPLAQSLPACCSPRVPCVFGALDLVSDGEVPTPYAHVPPLSDLLLMLRPPPLQAVMMKFPFCAFHPVVCSDFV